jgi:hypothetical protein
MVTLSGKKAMLWCRHTLYSLLLNFLFRHIFWRRHTRWRTPMNTLIRHMHAAGTHKCQCSSADILLVITLFSKPVQNMLIQTYIQRFCLCGGIFVLLWFHLDGDAIHYLKRHFTSTCFWAAETTCLIQQWINNWISNSDNYDKDEDLKILKFLRHRMVKNSILPKH